MTAERRQQLGYYPVSGCGGNIAWHTEDDTLEIADGITYCEISACMQRRCSARPTRRCRHSIFG